MPEDQWAEAMKEYLDKFSIPVDLNIAELIDRSERFEPVPAIDIDELLRKGPYAFDKYVTKHVILEGKPLVIKGLDRKLDLSLYTTDWLIKNYGAKGTYSHHIVASFVFGHSLNLHRGIV